MIFYCQGYQGNIQCHVLFIQSTLRLKNPLDGTKANVVWNWNSVNESVQNCSNCPGRRKHTNTYKTIDTTSYKLHTTKNNLMQCFGFAVMMHLFLVMYIMQF